MGMTSAFLTGCSKIPCAADGWYSPLYVIHLGVHAHYVLFTLIPLHALFRTPWLLVVLNPIVLRAAALGLWKLAQPVFGDAVAVLAVSAYWTSPWVLASVDGGFRPESFYPLIGFLFLYAWRTARPALIIGTAIAFLAIKEDAAILLAAFCFGAILFEKNHRRLAWALIALSAVSSSASSRSFSRDCSTARPWAPPCRASGAITEPRPVRRRHRCSAIHFGRWSRSRRRPGFVSSARCRCCRFPRGAP